MKQSTKTTVVILSMIFIGFSCQNKDNSKSRSAATNSTLETVIPTLPPDSSTPPEDNLNQPIANELVCMVNDEFMGRKQFPVPVGDKIYYGCCENCVDKLQNSDQYRYGIDPLTREKVDKVEAFIVRQSEKDYSVFYFKSKENFDKFMLKKSS
jgi:hypothetical protein